MGASAITYKPLKLIFFLFFWRRRDGRLLSKKVAKESTRTWLSLPWIVIINNAVKDQKVVGAKTFTDPVALKAEKWRLKAMESQKNGCRYFWRFQFVASGFLTYGIECNSSITNVKKVKNMYSLPLTEVLKTRKKATTQPKHAGAEKMSQQKMAKVCRFCWIDSAIFTT